MLKPHQHRPDLLAKVRAAYEAPSLYDQALRLLSRRGITVPKDHTERDWTGPYQASDAVTDACWNPSPETFRNISTIN